MVGDMVVFVCVCVYGGGFGAKQLQTTHDTCTRQLAFTFTYHHFEYQFITKKAKQKHKR